MIRIENRFQLKQVRAECQAETKQEKCRVLICGGTGCLAGGSAKLYEHMKELAAEHGNVQVEIGLSPLSALTRVASTASASWAP